MSDITEKKIDMILKEIDSSLAYHVDSHLREAMNLDSLDVFSFLFEIEQQFDIKIPEEDLEEYQLLYLGNLATYINDKIAS